MAIGLLIFLLIVGIPCLFLGRNINLSGGVQVFENAVVDHRSKQVKFFTFIEVDEVWQERMGTFVKIKTKLGEVFEFGDIIQDIQGFALLIQQKMAGSQLPKALEEYDQRMNRTFGKEIELTQQGLMLKSSTPGLVSTSSGTRTLPYGDYTGFEFIEKRVTKGSSKVNVSYVLFHSQHDQEWGNSKFSWGMVPEANIPNLYLLHAMIEHFKNN